MPEFIDRIQKEWPVISGAPWSFLTAVAASGVLIWLFLWIIHRKEIAGKNATIETHNKAQIESKNERLNLAADQAAIADKDKDELEKQVQTLRVELAALAALTAKAENASWAKVEAQLQRVEAGLAKLATANNAVSSTLSATLKVTEAPDVASFTVDTNSLDFAQYGALRKLDPEVLKKLQDLGKPFKRGMIEPKD